MLQTSDRSRGEFSGRISKINKRAGLLRVRVNFQNLRYLIKGNRVEFWSTSSKRCSSEVLGKTNDYILLKVPLFDRCFRHVLFTTGAFLHFYSDDLVKNIEKGKEVVDILLKKRIALDAKKRRLERELYAYSTQVETINQKYEVLKARLDKEWRKTLDNLEDQRTAAMRNLKNAEINLGDVDYKLQQYRISDHNLERDRWSLDQRLYFDK